MPKTYLTTPEELAPYHIDKEDAWCHEDGDRSKPCRHCGGQIRIHVKLAEAFLMVRTAAGIAIKWSSGFRCNAKQRFLYEHASAEEKADGLVAPPGSSPHEKAAAGDWTNPDTRRWPTAKAWGEFILATLTKAKIAVRIGCLRYKSFAHVDVLNLLEGKPSGIRW